MKKIEKYVNDLFKEAPNTSKTMEIKEELTNDLIEKYNDLIKEGKSQNEAYSEVILGIGDISQLINSLNVQTPNSLNESRKKTALVVSVSVFIYILSIVMVVILAENNMPDFVVVSVFLLLLALATCLLIYHFMSMPKYTKIDETIAEEFKEWKRGKEKRNLVQDSIGSIIWTTATIVYLLVSFTSLAWHITWIIFIIAAVVQDIVKLLFELGGK